MLKKRTYENKHVELNKALENSGMAYKEFAAMGLEKVNVKSKKKRIRQKALKKALTKKEVAKEILLMVQGVNQGSQKVDKQELAEKNEATLSVRGLPVTFLLKLGKKYLKEEDVVRFYYNADKEEFYKNKKLLEDVVEVQSVSLDSNAFASFQADVKLELDKRAKK